MAGKIALVLIALIVIETVNCGVLTERVRIVINNIKVFFLTNRFHIQDPRAYNTNQIDTKAKRPFCNAFTGCGRKRSNEIAPPPAIPAFDDEDSSVSELLELNSEPAIENLMRQIMSEAKINEAIQEANREMFLQKLKHANNVNRAAPSAYSLQ
jgi:hypothetical protein